jgi:hypothetical protein
VKRPVNLVRAFAVLCVAATSVYIMWMAYRVNETLSGPGWCRTALGAEKASSSDGTIKGLDACVGLLTVQLRSLATNSHILFGVIALCLAVLVVIVLADGHVGLKVNKDGGDVDIGKAPVAAQAVADSAQATADTIKDAAP